ncbi:glycosyltransferase family 2 protein [Pseudomonas carassii]|uniref:Glycosyltransferase family A protein n=1 Tax=Pseudomonas carassii TaxID=3115855 RepID=A0ABU7HCR3_9PSED|nr:glycosyltransferase family A protein [Pseudomonas sp. 137P]MEE1888743.1 glycosyltransferase family A protein [Pseudomonas sp. 137P]
MKVEKLLSAYKFESADGFEALEPDVSIILPTYSRAASGLFERVVRSILSQHLSNFELIIIDDASTDGTEALIKQFMAEDSRIATLRYAQRIGLPAISVNLGFEYSRGQRILFAFDDNVLTPHGLLALYDHMQHGSVRICYGQTRMKTELGWVLLGDGDFDSHFARYNNSIGNGAILFDRTVFDEVGLYDPHVIIARLCDWDLWRRMKHIGFHRVDTVVNEEHGVTLADSLGNSLNGDYVAALEWAHTSRNDKLKPSVWKQYEMLQPPPFLSYPRVLKLAEMVEQSYGHLGEPVEPMRDDTTQGYLLVLGDMPVSGELVFSVKTEQIIEGLDLNVFMNYKEDFLQGCRAVIISRVINKSVVALVDVLRKAGVPYYYYLDDILVSDKYKNLFSQPELIEAAAFYSSPEALDLIRHAQAVLATSDNLVKAMQAYNDKVLRINCTPPLALGESHVESVSHFSLSEGECIRVGFFSSISKIKAFLQYKAVFERIHQETGRKVELYIPCFPAQMPELEAFFADAMAYVRLKLVVRESSYVDFIFKARAERLHYLIHSYNAEEVSGTDFYLYKTFNILISAYLCNVVPVVPLRPPFGELKDSNPVLGELITTSDDEVFAVMMASLNKPSVARRYIKAMDAYIQRYYPNSINQTVLDDILRAHPAQYDNVLELDMSDLVVPRLVFPRRPVALRRDSAVPVAQFREDNVEDKPFVLIHHPDAAYFRRNQLIVEALQAYPVICFIPNASPGLLKGLSDEYRGSNIQWCADMRAILECMASVGLLISPFVLPIPSHESAWPLLMSARRLKIPVLGVQHGLFQLGLNQRDGGAHGIVSYSGPVFSMPMRPVCDVMLDWFDGESGIGYARDTSVVRGVKRGTSVLIAANLNWHIYTRNERMAFVTAVLQLVRQYPDQQFIWKMHPNEKSSPQCQEMRAAIQAAVEELDNLEIPDAVLPTESLIARARLLITAPSTLILDAEASACPTVVFNCAANSSLVSAIGHEARFGNFLELHNVFVDAMADIHACVLSTGLLKPFNEPRFIALVDQHLRREPADAFEAINCAREFMGAAVAGAAVPAVLRQEIAALKVEVARNRKEALSQRVFIQRTLSAMHAQAKGVKGDKPYVAWESLPAGFDMLKAFTQARFSRISKRKLVLSRDLRSSVYQEFIMPIDVSGLKRISLAVSPLLPVSDGEFGVEIISHEQKIVAQAVVPFSAVAHEAPTHIALASAISELKAGWGLRVFVRNVEVPVFIYELGRNSLIRRRSASLPLLSLH